jgi:hypothetical protein
MMLRSPQVNSADEELKIFDLIEQWPRRYTTQRLGGGQAHDQSNVSTVDISLGSIWAISIFCSTKPGLTCLTFTQTRHINIQKEEEEKTKKLKRKNKTKMLINKQLKMYICTYRMTDPSTRQGEYPKTKPQLSWLKPKFGHETQRGSMPRRLDWHSDFNSDFCEQFQKIHAGYSHKYHFQVKPKITLTYGGADILLARVHGI